MSSSNLSESHSAGSGHPIFWALFGGAIAVALVDLYPAGSLIGLSLGTAIAFLSCGAIVAAAAKPEDRWISLWAVLPGSVPALVPLALITSPRAVQDLWELIVGDLLQVIVALGALALSTQLIVFLSSYGRASEPKKDWSAEKREFQELKLAKVRDALKNKNVTDRLDKMIDYAVGRVDYYEDLRHRHLNIGLGLVTGATAIAGFLLKGAAGIPPLAAFLLGVGAVWLLATGTWLIFYYNHTSSPHYVYRAVADIRSWYYAYNLPPGSSKVLSTDQGVAKEQLGAVQDNFAKFLDRWIAWANDGEAFVGEDLEQVFILQFIQGYKNEVVRAMQRKLVIGLTGFSVTIGLALVAWLLGFVASLT